MSLLDDDFLQPGRRFDTVGEAQAWLRRGRRPSWVARVAGMLRRLRL